MHRSRAVVLVALLTAGLLSSCAQTPDAGSPRDRASRSKQSTPAEDGAEPLGGGTGSRQVRALARGPISAGWRASRIVDGDTVEVTRGRRALTVRLIGIDTPETVHPTEPVECYGPEATAFATRWLLGESVVLELDPSQGRQDYYGRTLAYVWRVRGADAMFNLAAVRRGYALEYTYDDPYAWQPELRRAQRHASEHQWGVWRCPHPGD